MAYTLASVPLALRYLDKAEFGLWGLTMQMAGYVALIDFGMGGVSRILIDYKDSKDEPTYGSVIQTTVLVSLVQAVLVLACGVALGIGLGPVVRIPEGFNREFMVLVIGQCGLIAGGFVTRIFTFLLSAHQRQDVLNYAQPVVFAGNFSVLWLCLASGIGVFSTLWAQLCGWALSTVIAIAWCFRLHVFPRAGCWGRPTWARFRESFAYGRDIFLFTVGSQLANASQMILVTRQLGLEAAAIWAVCTRSYVLVTHLIYRIFDNSCPALAEMIVRGEKDWLQRRFHAIVVVSGSASIVAGVIFAICNQHFVRLWTNGEVSWPVINDALLAVALVLSVIAHCHVGLVGQTKEFRSLRYISLLEGFWFVGCSVFVLRWAGIPGMLVIAIVSTLLFSFAYGTWRTARYFGFGWNEAALNWSWPSLRLALLLVPVGCALFFAMRALPALAQLMVGGIVTAAVGSLLFLRYGLDSGLRSELFQRLPTWLPTRLRGR